MGSNLECFHLLSAAVRCDERVVRHDEPIASISYHFILRRDEPVARAYLIFPIRCGERDLRRNEAS